MVDDRKRLVFMALIALDEVEAQSRRGQVAGSFAIRTALAVLYAHAEGERRCFDDFWREMQDAHASRPASTAGDMRAGMVRTAMNGILIALRIDASPDIDHAISDARRGKPFGIQLARFWRLVDRQVKQGTRAARSGFW